MTVATRSANRYLGPPSPSIASVDTYLRFAEAVNRDLTENGTKLTELLEDS